MTKERIARIARLVRLRQQQRQLREAEHATAAQAVERAESLRARFVETMDDLDRQHDEAVGVEIDPLDLDLLGAARRAVHGRLREASDELSQAAVVVEERRAQLLDAHRAHRSLELYHDRLNEGYRRDSARAEQREIDELALRVAADGRSW